MIQQNHIAPPRWPLKFLRFFLKKEFLEEIEGDMEEVFNDNLEQLSLKKANRIYTWEMLKLLRPVLIRNLEVIENLIQHGMLKNYFKVSIRGLMKNPLNSFINVFGLSAAIGICVFAYAFAQWTYNTDQFHKLKNEVYLTTFFADRDGSQQQFGITPRPLGEMLREDFAQIKKVCRVEDRNVVMKYNDNVFHERVRFTDPEFLEMLTFPLKWGTANSLTDVNSIVLSEDMAIKYFGEKNPIGETIIMIFGKGHNKAFKITGVADEFPKARTISFNFLVNFQNIKTLDPTYDFQDWKASVNATLIQVETPSDLIAIKLGMEKYKKLQNQAADEDWAISSFGFEPLATLHERSTDIRDDISRSSDSNYKTIIYLGIVCGFLFLLACFNYINISITTAAKRLKEIGVRKSIGATRRVMIVQFLVENIVLTFFALIVGLILGMTFFIPGFESLWDFDMDFRLTDFKLWIYLPIILLITSIVSGIYPSLYISKFQVVGILQGSVKFGQKNPLTKIFLCFQLVMACIFIATAVGFKQNSDYLAQRSWGYNQAETMYAMVPDQASYEKLSSLMSQDPDVVSISGSLDHLGKPNATAVLRLGDRHYEVDQFSVDPNYFATMGLPLKEGRVFNDHEGSDKQSVVINELLAKNMKWESPLGQTFKIDSTQYEVIGVLKEFHSYSFNKAIRPTIFKVASKDAYHFLAMQVRPGAEIKAYKSLQSKWSQLFPETPFNGGLQEDVWGGFFEANEIYGIVWTTLASIVIALASLGLYGLVTLNVAGRTKEFSIRRVLGAGVKNIAGTISNQYLVLFFLALAIGSPLGYLVTKFFFGTFQYHMQMNFTGVIIAIVCMIAVFLITIFSQVRKVAKENPVNGLKAE
jgi:putative ABC transport system permease protein